ncbi:lipopolysaccharide assembly protein LapA domain-containing protein [Novipirellula artificiosorum]|uniref:Lipopolysaccharide assembly protein A domain-containing protein n=1 Tax=Novipirellula artificiosorum TaxID=2528016 RepID=A0A5C6DED3_9BACT|nr:LapA family protein [Novipirellula artificiosorum]TWU35082.1 hypothetical protein Poly41_42260 [Novipirellula artificiosorum]
MRQKIRWFLLLAGVIVALAIAVQNNAMAEVKLFFFSRDVPLSLLIVTSAGAGFLLGSLMTYSMLRAQKKTEPKAKEVKTAPKQAEAVDELRGQTK